MFAQQEWSLISPYEYFYIFKEWKGKWHDVEEKSNEYFIYKFKVRNTKFIYYYLDGRSEYITSITKNKHFYKVVDKCLGVGSKVYYTSSQFVADFIALYIYNFRHYNFIKYYNYRGSY